MNAPAYHLRPNKAVDRFLLVESLKRLEKAQKLSDFTYFGLGGPYLEDFRSLHENFENIHMVSIEKNREVFQRQKFHRPFSTLELLHVDLFDFINAYEAGEKKAVFWLDYTDLKYCNLEYFGLLMKKVPINSILKISLRAEAEDYFDCNRCVNSDCQCNRHGANRSRFREEFGELMPRPDSDPPRREEMYVKLIQDLVRLSTVRALIGEPDLVFQPINSFYYRDSVGILTVTGVVCFRTEICRYRDVFDGWEFANLDWSEPKRIRIPVLSTKERLKLQPRLPNHGPVGKTLHRELGYLISGSKRSTRRQLENYSEFHLYYPYLIRGIP